MSTATLHLEVQALRGLEADALDLAPGAVTEVVRPHGAGKTTLAAAVVACLTRDPNPLALSAANAYRHADANADLEPSAVLFPDDRAWRLTWRPLARTVDAEGPAPLVAPLVARVHKPWTAGTRAEQAAAWLAALGDEGPAPDAVRTKLDAIPGLDDDLVDTLMHALGDTRPLDFDAALAAARDAQKACKTEWLAHVAAAGDPQPAYGHARAAAWRPADLTPDDDAHPEEAKHAADAALAHALDTRERLGARKALEPLHAQATARERTLAHAAADAPADDADASAPDAPAPSARERTDKALAHVARIEEALHAHQTRHAEADVPDAEAEAAFTAEENRIKNRLRRARKAHEKARAQESDATPAPDADAARLDETRRHAAALAQAMQAQGTPDPDGAEQALRAARQRARRAERSTEAHAAVDTSLRITRAERAIAAAIEVLSPDGALRAECATAHHRTLTRWIDGLAAFANLTRVTLDGPRLHCNDRPVEQASTAEQWWTLHLARLALAARAGAPVHVVDGAETLTPQWRARARDAVERVAANAPMTILWTEARDPEREV